MQNRPQRSEDSDLTERDRADERGDATQPDAPNAAEPNEGMSTILGTDPLDSVQGDQ